MRYLFFIDFWLNLGSLHVDKKKFVTNTVIPWEFRLKIESAEVSIKNSDFELSWVKRSLIKDCNSSARKWSGNFLRPGMRSVYVVLFRWLIYFRQFENDLE